MSQIIRDFSRLGRGELRQSLRMLLIFTAFATTILSRNRH